MKNILDIAKSYLAGRSGLADVLGGGDKAAKYVAEQMQRAARSFRTHKGVDVFYVTGNQVFYGASDAANHAQSCDDKNVLEFKRNEVAELLKEGVNDDELKRMEEIAKANQLNELINAALPVFTEVEITEAHLAEAPQLAEKGVKPGDKIYHFDKEVTQDDLDNNPSLVGVVEVGATIEIPLTETEKEDLVKAITEHVIAGADQGPAPSQVPAKKATAPKKSVAAKKTATKK